MVREGKLYMSELQLHELHNTEFPLPDEMQDNIAVTSLSRIYNWSRRSSMWPMLFGLACCAIEMIATAASRYDLARFGMEVMRASPRQSDLMIVSGTVTKKMVVPIVRLYNQMPEPKYVMAMGACATGGGPFKEGYNVVSGVDKYLPVDVYIPGCPPTPQALLNGLIMLQKKIDGEKIDMPIFNRKGNTPWYRSDVERDIPIPVLGPDLVDLRTVEIAAERTAMGLIEAHEAGLPKPAKIPAPQPEPESEDGGVGRPAPSAAAEDGGVGRTAPGAAAPKAPSKIDLIRAKARGE